MDRGPERLLPAGERDAWRSTRGFGHSANESEAEQPAPWHQPYEEPRTAAKDYRRRPTVSRPPSPHHPVKQEAGAKDFLNLAHTIETLRRERAAQSARAERARERSAIAPRPAPATRTAIAPSRTLAPRPPADVPRHRPPATVASTESLAGRDGLITDLVRSISRTADKSDVARLEEILCEVLSCLKALEGASTHPSRPALDTVDAPRQEPRPGARAPRSTSPRRLWT
ncbi:MAG: hypothetical protein AAGD34_00425 [Pseudomonadota bacterium]